MKPTIALIALLLVACSSPAVSREPDPTATPGKYTDAEQADILAESIELVHGTDPQPAWYPAFVSLTVEDRWASVTTTLTEADAELAEAMCRDIAMVTYDDESEPIGVTDVLIFGAGGNDLVDCDVVPL